MAYSVIFLAAETSQVEEFQKNHKKRKTIWFRRRSDIYIKPDKIAKTTHYYASAGSGDKIFDETISNVFDGGEILSKQLWHPYRPPMLINSHLVHELAVQFEDRFVEYKKHMTEEEQGYADLELGIVSELLQFASQRELCVISFLDKPFDEKRAKKVKFPIAYKYLT